MKRWKIWIFKYVVLFEIEYKQYHYAATINYGSFPFYRRSKNKRIRIRLEDIVYAAHSFYTEFPTHSCYVNGEQMEVRYIHELRDVLYRL